MSNFTRKIKNLKRKELEKEIKKHMKEIMQNGKIPLGEGYLFYLRKTHKIFEKRWNEIDQDHKDAWKALFNNVPDIAHHLNDILWEVSSTEGDCLEHEGQWRVNTEQGKLLMLLALPSDNEEIVLMDQEKPKVKLYGMDGSVIN